MATRFNYSKMKSTAERLIDRFGQGGIIRRKGEAGASSPWNPAAAPETDFPITFVLTDYSMKDKSGSLVQMTDKKAYISTEGVSISPNAGDQLVTENELFSIVSINPLAPGGMTLLWEAQVRR